MMFTRISMTCAATLLLAVTVLPGCQTGDLTEQRDALWLQNNQLQDELNRTRAALEAAEADRSGLQSQINQLKDRLAQRPAPAPPPAAANTGFGSIQGVEAIESAGRITVRVPGDVLFASGKVDLKASALSTLDQIAGVIQREYPTNTIRVVGHTDTDPIRKSKWKDNLELSLQRAAAVHRYLQTRGIDPTRMEAVGQGQWRPGPTKAKSRRVEIVVVLKS